MRLHRYIPVSFSVFSLALVVLGMAAIWALGLDPEPKKRVHS